MTPQGDWPALPREAWINTRDTMHLYTQIMGKIRLALTPVEREWANVPLYLSARGLTTSAIPYHDRMLQLDLDCIRHTLDISVSDGQYRSIALVPALCVADFYEKVMAVLAELHIAVHIWPMPSEIPNAILCSEDRVHNEYDVEYVNRFWTVLVRIGSVFAEHRAGYRGRHTPVQFFWGSFDLAYVRFSGRDLEPPASADPIRRVGMDAEEISVGFWPGDERFPEAALFCYGYPKPDGFERATIRPAAAFWNETMGEFMLRYEDIRRAASPHAAVLEFLRTSYEAAATLGGWNRAALENSATPEA